MKLNYLNELHSSRDSLSMVLNDALKFLAKQEATNQERTAKGLAEL